MYGYVKGRRVSLLMIIVLPLLVAGCVEGQIVMDEAATRPDEREVARQAPAGPNEQEAEMIEVYANANWYRARPEPEQSWHGLLQKREGPIGPATRSALRYTLVTEEDQLPVYAANAERLLDPFVGRQVSVEGKLVDLSDEGYGIELWIAVIDTSGYGD
jgi:hypothetical protein